MRRREEGSSIIEYLILTTAIVAGMAALSQGTGCRTQALMNTTIQQIPIQ